MTRDVNIVVLSGTVSSSPTVVTTRTSKRICLFNLTNIEKYRLHDGRAAQHENTLVIEALGRNVDKCLSEVKHGDRCQINGYLRVDSINGEEKVRIRAFHIEKE